MAYSLQDARTALKSRLLWLQQRFVREPLDGLVNGTNKVFHLPYFPVEADSAVVYNSSGTALSATADYALDETGGAVVFTTAPASACTISYTYQPFTDTQLLSMTEFGFDHMQRIRRRALYLVTATSTTYISSTSATTVDPVLGSVIFGSSRVQQDFLVTCSERVLTEALLQKAALEAIDAREGITGMRLDRTKRPQTLQLSLDAVDKRVQDAADMALAEAGDTSLFGGGLVPGARSDTHIDWYDWWTDGRQDRGVVS